MTGRTRRVWLSDLIGSRVLDSEGTALGRVVEIELDSRYRAVKIHIGRFAWLQRLHLVRLARRDPKAVDWQDVAEFKDFQLRLRRTREDVWPARKR